MRWMAAEGSLESVSFKNAVVYDGDEMSGSTEDDILCGRPGSGGR